MNKREMKISTKEVEKNKRNLRSATSCKDEIDKLYFESYEDIYIHEEMLTDQPRMSAYKESISISSTEKIVIDVGAGSGVLSIFAADAG